MIAEAAGYLLFLVYLLGCEASRVGAGGAPLLALHAATAPLATAAGGAALADALLAAVRRPARAAAVPAADTLPARVLGSRALAAAALAQVAARIALWPRWDVDAALFAAGLLVTPPLASLLAARRLRLSRERLREAGLRLATPASLALAPWVACLALFLALGPLALSLDGHGVLARASRAALVEGRLLTWAPLVVTAAWLALLARVARRGAGPTTRGGS